MARERHRRARVMAVGYKNTAAARVCRQDGRLPNAATREFAEACAVASLTGGLTPISQADCRPRRHGGGGAPLVLHLPGTGRTHAHGGVWARGGPARLPGAVGAGSAPMRRASRDTGCARRVPEGMSPWLRSGCQALSVVARFDSQVHFHGEEAVVLIVGETASRLVAAR